MALDTDRVGKVYPSYRYEVSREKIREYAHALGETDERYVGDGDVVAPPTFAACAALTRGSAAVFADPGLGTHPALLHGTQEFRFGERPMRPGDVLRCTPSIASITTRGSNEIMDVEVECTFDDGTHAVTSVATLVFLGSAPREDAP